MKLLTPIPLGAALLTLACGAASEPPSGAATDEPPALTATATHPVAVELFTSQGCSSCPPADAVMAKLATQSDVIAITRPVTYWDRLGWRDTLALPANTELQRAYTARGIPGAGTYTPQSVVQGRTGIVGGREAEIRGAIVRASRLPEPGLAIATAAGGARIIRLSGETSGAVVSVAALKAASDVTIRRGENGGRTLHYANALVSEQAIGEWRGGESRLTVPASALRIADADRYAVIVREGRAGPILAARYL